MDSINNQAKLGGDAWLELQAFKTRQINRREKLNRHKDLVNEITTHRPNNQLTQQQHQHQHQQLTSKSTNTELNKSHLYDSSARQSLSEHANDGTICNDNINSKQNESSNLTTPTEAEASVSREQNTDRTVNNQSASKHIPSLDSSPALVGIDTVECLLLLKLCDVALKLPIDSKSLQRSICKLRGLENTSQSLIESLLQKFALQELITIEEPTAVTLNGRKRILSSIDDDHYDETSIFVISADHTRLVELDRSFGTNNPARVLLLESKCDDVESEKRDISTSSVQQCRSPPLQNGADLDDYHKFTKPSANHIYNPKVNDNRLQKSHHSVGIRPSNGGDDIESLLSLSSTRERESKKLGEELLELLSKPTAKERNLLESFRSADGYQVQEFCPKGTKDECRRNNKGTDACDKLHFRKIIAKHTEESLGDCSFLNTCFHMDSCKYVHYEVDYDNDQQSLSCKKPQKSLKTKGIAKKTSSGRISVEQAETTTPASNDLVPAQKATDITNKLCLSAEEQARIDIRNRKRFKTILYPPQWIQCDLRYFDMSLLGKFSVVMADPPWDIHMELPYGTMSDDEMRKLNVPALQDEGVIFLWVTGRAMELGRECLALWGYERCDEIIWVKTNQLQRIIRTGRTGHWLNHGKEHCLVGVKGNPNDINRGLDCDIIVAEVRATSHKPDEIYGIIERLSPGTRKIELFGRAHNVQPNWITLGNQLNGVRLVEPSLIEAFKKLDLPFDSA